MTISELKKYIFENNKIEYILENLDCHNIKYNSKRNYYSASFPDGDNPAGVNIRNNKYLDYWSYTRGVSYEDRQDLINLVEYINRCNFINAIKYLHKILGLEYRPQIKRQQKKEEKFDPLAIFKKVKRHNRRINVDDLHVINEEVLDEYIPLLHIDWFREGIMPWSAKKFGLAYSYKRKRVIVPHRYWLTNELIGINARTTIENYDELGIPKYLLSKGYNKAINVYGYCENRESIEQLGYCVLFESEKSVLKRDSRNDPSGLAISGKSISDEQVRVILSLNIKEIVIAFDKDVCIEEIRHVCEKFYRIRNVSYIHDKWDLLGDKDSPADANNKIYEFLFKFRTTYNEYEHQKYLRSLNSK